MLAIDYRHEKDLSTDKLGKLGKTKKTFKLDHWDKYYGCRRVWESSD